jgi:hypothetical protein
MNTRTQWIVASGMAALLAFTGTVRANEPAVEVVASGLDSPRGLAVQRDVLYVVEAGSGGDGPCFSTERAEFCLGATGAITRVLGGEQTRVLTGLPSLVQVGPEGEVSGPSDISFRGRSAYVTLGLGATEATRAELGRAGAKLGHLLVIRALGTDAQELRVASDITAFETAHNPDNGQGEAALDSNPHALLASRRGTVIVDAGGNDVLELNRDGVRVLAAFPPRDVPGPDGNVVPMQAVPDSVALGPDGAYYVGELTGFPFPVGGARIYRIVPGEEPSVYAEGFTNIIDLAFDDQGGLFVLEHVRNGLLGAADDPSGRLVHVATDGTQSTVLTDRLVRPTALAFGPDGELYVSNHGVTAGQGEVLKLTL